MPGREAGKQADMLSLQNRLGVLETELERTFAEAGKRSYELLRMRQMYDDETKMILGRVKELQDEMMDIRQQVQDLRTNQQPAAPADTDRHCAECGKVASDTEAFCSGCGAKLPAVEA